MELKKNLDWRRTQNGKEKTQIGKNRRAEKNTNWKRTQNGKGKTQIGKKNTELRKTGELKR